VAAAQVGRQLGAYLFYLLSRVTVGPLLRLARFIGNPRLVDRSAALLNRLNLDSPFSVALGRLLYLRVPITLVLGTRRQAGKLALGVLLSSLVFDGTCLLIGTLAGTAVTLNPWLLLIILLAGLGSTYIVFYFVRRLIRAIIAAHILKTQTGTGVQPSPSNPPTVDSSSED
jgi:membrane-associated protein